LRIACNSSDSFRLAGERGWRIFCSPVVVPMPRLQDDLTTYRSLLQEYDAPPPDDAVALMTSIYVNASASKALEIPEASLNNYLSVLQQMQTASRAADRSSDSVQVNARAQEMQARLQNMTYAEATRTFAIYGEPAHCIDRIQALKETFGVNQFIGWFNTGGLIPHQQVMDSMTLFAERVMPYIA
jgi:alkanesulfonate monooxygenase SsuD/methylene tetrahydromethanopterin reductase-like flavin-dependent oxidoreductase (luciferase family)